jgi:hypothetical protein
MTRLSDLRADHEAEIRKLIEDHEAELAHVRKALVGCDVEVATLREALPTCAHCQERPAACIGCYEDHAREDCNKPGETRRSAAMASGPLTCHRCGEETLSVHAEPGSLCEDCRDELEDEDARLLDASRRR